MPTPEVVLHEAARAGMKRGFDTLARVLALTLGPSGRTVLATSYHGALPELLSDSATIARRFVALPDRCENAGAMLLRNLVWQQHQRCGDGCATAAVLAQAILTAASRQLAAGCDPNALRSGIERATAAAIADLQAQARPLAHEDELLHVAQSMLCEPRLSLLLAELFDLLGSDGFVAIENYAAPLLEREYREGGQWKARLASAYFAHSPTGESPLWPPRAVLRDAAVALFAGEVHAIADVAPLLELVAQSERPRLLLVVYNISDPALTTLVLNHQRGGVQVLAAELRTGGAQRSRDLEDLAALTGARLLNSDSGDRLGTISAAMLGSVRRAEATDSTLVVSGLRGGFAARARIDTLRARMLTLDANADEEHQELRARLGRLSSGSAVLKIGASSAAERDMLRRQAEQAIAALPLALRAGVVPGGGVAYLHAAESLASLPASGGASVGVTVLRRALEAPFRQIVANVGRRDSSSTLAALRQLDGDAIYDGVRDSIMPLTEARLLDPVDVLCEALRVAASGAVMALTTEALVLKRHPETSFTP